MIKSPRRHLFALGGYVLLTVLMTYPLLLHSTTAIPGDGFDGWDNYWNLWWVKTAVLNLHDSPYFTTYLYHPTGHSLYFHTLNLFNALLTLPIQLVFGVALSYNFVVLFCFVIGGYGAYLLALHILEARDRPNDHVIAFLAGVVFTFSPFHFAHLLGHMSVISLEWLPFYTVVLVKSLATERIRLGSHIGLPVLFLVLTAFCNWYFVLYLLIFTALYLGYRIWIQRRLGPPLLRTGLILVLSGMVLSPLLVRMVGEALQDPAYLLSPFKMTRRLSADLLAFVTPNELHPVWGGPASRLSETFTGSTIERMVFAGYIPLALAGYALWSRRRATCFWLVSCLTFFILSLGPYLHIAGREVPVPLPYLALYRLLPFFKIARSVSRFDVMVMLSLALLTALGLQRLVTPLTKTGRRALSLATLGLVCFEFLPVPYPVSEVEVPSFYQSLAVDEEEYAILELPMNWDRPAHMLYQTVHHKPIITGYLSRPNPLALVERVPVLQHFRFLGPDIIAQAPGEVAPQVFEYLGIRYVIVHEYMLPPGKEREAVFGLVQEVFADQLPSYQDEQITVYQVGEQEPGSPFLILGPEWGERQKWQGKPAREVGLEASCVIIASTAGETQFAFSAFSKEGTHSLELSLNGEIVESYEIAPQAEQIGTAPLSLEEGVNTLQLRDRGEGEPSIVVTSLDLYRDW
ncbi:MAG: hypothetical protein WBB22_04270 [Anaerolineae bacterium]